MEIVREYTNGELTVIWKPGLCIHAGVCVRMLPQVYRPRLRPRGSIRPGRRRGS